MKKLLFITVLFLGMINLKAQDMHFGARVAVSFTNLRAVALKSDANDFVAEQNKAFKSLTNFELGAFAEFMLSDQIAIAPELNYAGAGSDLSGHDGDGDYTGNVSLTYIQIPVMIKYYVNENISINAGPQIGFLGSATAFFEQGDYSKTYDMKDEYNSTDLGLNIGGSYKMENGLFFDLRYYLGMSGLQKNAEYSNLKNTGLKFGVGYYFNN